MIKVDTREKQNSHITKFFKENGIEFCTDKTCYIGDYCNTENPNVYVERKNSWDELAGNCGRNHDRFKRELERLDDCGGKMFIVVETNIPLNEWKPKHVRKMTAEQMDKILTAWAHKHRISIMTTPKEQAGQWIYKILTGVKANG